MGRNKFKQNKGIFWEIPKSILDTILRIIDWSLPTRIYKVLLYDLAAHWYCIMQIVCGG